MAIPISKPFTNAIQTCHLDEGEISASSSTILVKQFNPLTYDIAITPHLPKKAVFLFSKTPLPGLGNCAKNQPLRFPVKYLNQRKLLLKKDIKTKKLYQYFRYLKS
jgi:hypothetical protein